MIIGICACDIEGGLGVSNKLPWPYIKEDMEFFREQTLNNIVLMGYNTFKSLNCRPLPNRMNVIVCNGVFVVDNIIPGVLYITHENAKRLLDRHREKINPKKNIYIIGGSKTYSKYMGYIDKFIITTIKSYFDCDVFINKTSIQKLFTSRSLVHQYVDEKNQFNIMVESFTRV